MSHFSYKGYIKIIIYENFKLSNIEIQHVVYLIWSDNIILNEIKAFILENIDLFS